MNNWLLAASMAVAAFARGFRSPLLRAPAYRMLFVLVVAGAVLICLLPEAVFILPALDAVGLDIATILVAFELRHYLLSLAQVMGFPTSLDACRRGVATIPGRRAIALVHPRLWPYACLWALIALRTFLGSMTIPQRAGG